MNWKEIRRRRDEHYRDLPKRPQKPNKPKTLLDWIVWLLSLAALAGLIYYLVLFPCEIMPNGKGCRAHKQLQEYFSH